MRSAQWQWHCALSARREDSCVQQCRPPHILHNMGSLPSRYRCLLLLLALAGFCIRSSSSETTQTLNNTVVPVESSSVSGSIRVVQETSTLGTSFLSSTLRVTSTPRPQMSPAMRITTSVFIGDPESETSDSVSAAVVGGVVIGLLVVVVVVIVIVIVAIVIVVRRKKSVYVLKPAQAPYFNNALYSEPTTDEDGAITVDTVDKSTVQYCSPLTLEESQLIATGILPRTYTKSYAELEPPHDYAEARLDGASLPQEYTYAASDHTGVGVPRFSLRAADAIYITPAADEGSLYAQFNRMQIKQISREHVKVADYLGSGQFGTVNKGEWQSPDGPVDVAVKTLNSGASDVDTVKFLQEAAIMGQFSHPNVVTMHGVVTIGQPILIVLELLSSGDLRKCLVALQDKHDEEEKEGLPHVLLSYCRQIASGMEYLSKKAFVHRDLAARNILVSEDDACKVADFGMSRDLADENYYISHGGKIPVKWSAPEALHFRKYSTFSDVWSYGVLMYEIWSLGQKPFADYTNMQSITLVDSGFRLPPPAGCPRAIYDLMIKCWHPESGHRPTFTAIVRALSRPDTHLLKWTKEDKSIHPEAASLGAKLKPSVPLFRDLRLSYDPKAEHDYAEDFVC